MRWFAIKAIKRLLLVTIVTMVAVLILAPLSWIFLTSLKSNPEVMQSAWSLPKVWKFSNYSDVFESGSFVSFFINSVFYSVISVALSILFCMMASFSLTRINVVGSKFFSLFLISGIMIPMNSLIVPLYLQVQSLNLLDSRWTLIIVYITFTIPVSIALISVYMKSIPAELEDAGLIDGCNSIQIFFRIIFPVSKPIIATVAILNFLSCWNEFIFAMMLTSNDKLRTLPVGLSNFRGQYSTNYTLMAAAIVIAMLPPIILFAFMQERVVKGITAGAVKG